MGMGQGRMWTDVDAWAAGKGDLMFAGYIGVGVGAEPPGGAAELAGREPKSGALPQARAGTARAGARALVRGGIQAASAN